MSHIEHHAKSPRIVTCAIVTISDTRTEDTDAGGQRIRDLLEAAGHCVCSRSIVRDEPARIRERLAECSQDPVCQAILMTGGTGISPRDRTFEIVSELLDKHLDGFGELFRMLSFQEIGPAAMLSRAVGGVYAGRILFSMPGSPNAVQLAMNRLILPELGHLVYELNKHPA
jgi:molybdenum cofactor biosynthesis protein B